MLSDTRSRLGRLRTCHPFATLSNRRFQEALDAVRPIDLGPGEAITVRSRSGGGEYVYVIDGDLDAVVGDATVVRCGPSDGEPKRIALAPGAAPLTLSTVGGVLLGRVDSEVLDYLASWETLGQGLGATPDAVATRVSAVRRSLAFRRLPLECVEEAFRRMKQEPVKRGQDVVRQGDPGDAFYVIEAGRAEVWRTGIYDDDPQKVDEMGPGEAFGEEALVLEGARGASVRMLEDGVLLRMEKTDFDELIGRQLIERVEPAVSKAMLDAGHVALDVRYDEEFEEGHLPGAISIPLPALRHRLAELDPAKP